MDRKEKLLFYFIILSFVGAFLSITLFQGFLILAIVTGFVILLKKRSFKGGIFTVPLLGHLAVIDLSSAFFLRVTEQWRRLLEQNFFTLTYFLSFVFSEKGLKTLVDYLFKLSIPLGYLVSFKVLYSYYLQHDIKAFWGGNFIIGNLLALPFFVSLYYLLTSTRNLYKIFSFLSALLFLGVSFLAVERSIILGFLIGIFLFGVAIFKNLQCKKWKILFSGTALLLTLVGTFIIVKHPKVQYWYHLVITEGVNERSLNSISSHRVEIAKGAIGLIKQAIENKDYVKLLIGWGYGPQKQYKNLPEHLQFINEYESFILITEFINGGLLGVLFILWFYIAAIVITVKSFKNPNNYWTKIVILSSVWVNLGYHLFTLFWVPVNALYYFLLGIVERLNNQTRK